MLHSLLPILAEAAPTAPDSGSAIDVIQSIFGPFGVKPYFLLAQVINFAAVCYVLNRFAFKPVLATLDERQKKIAEGLQYTEEMKIKLADAKNKHAEILRRAAAEAHQIEVNARNAAKRIVDKATASAAQQAEAIIKNGEQAVALERQQMLAELRREVAQLVLDTTGRVLARDLTPDERSRFSATAAQDLSKN
ncbi:MAG: F0F1 ATP synthase subunit B [Opitutales bacterium]|jgi:F-type H+-transporting ATPase subunit b